MRLDDYLHRAQLLDCHGRVTHTLTVQLDGNVRVSGGARDVLVDPRARRVLTPHTHLAPEIVAHACTLAAETFR